MKHLLKRSNWLVSLALGAMLLLVFGCENQGPVAPVREMKQVASGETIQPNFRTIQWGGSRRSFNKIQEESKYIDYLSGGKLNLSYTSTVEDDLWPYVIFSDQRMNLDKGTGVVNGDVYSNDQVNLKPDRVLLNGTESEKFMEALMPTVDWNYFREQAQAAGQYVNGNMKFLPGESPYSGVWYVQGKVEIQENVVVNGCIITENDCALRGSNIVLRAIPSTLPAIVAGKDIKVEEENVEITGLVLALQNIQIKKTNFKLTGAIISGNQFDEDSDDLLVQYDENYINHVTGIDLRYRTNHQIKVSIEFEVLPESMPQSSTIALSMDDSQLSGGVNLEFSPHGTVFNPPAILNIKVEGLDLSQVDQSKLGIYYINEESNSWELMQYEKISVDIKKGKLEVKNARLPHFSRYAIGDMR